MTNLTPVAGITMWFPKTKWEDSTKVREASATEQDETFGTEKQRIDPKIYLKYIHYKF